MLTENPFHDYSLTQMLAFVYRKYGAAGLKRLLDGDPRRPGEPVTKKEYLQDAIHELEGLGLNKVSSIIAKYTAKAPSIYDVEIACKHMRKGHEKRKEADKAKYPWRTALRSPTLAQEGNGVK